MSLRRLRWRDVVIETTVLVIGDEDDRVLGDGGNASRTAVDTPRATWAISHATCPCYSELAR